MSTCPQEATTAAPLTRAQVAAAGLPAWSAPTGIGDSAFYFDGTGFLRRSLLGERRPTAVSAVPETGWRHRRGCGCALCRTATQADGHHDLPPSSSSGDCRGPDPRGR